MTQPNELIQQFQAGDQKSFSRLYTMYSEALFGIIFSVVHEETTSEEVLQDTFIKIWDNRESYDIDKGRFFTWMLNIARNTAIDKTRSKDYKNSRKNLHPENFVDIFETTDSLNRKTNTIGIKKFIDVLKPVCKKLIDLLIFKGFTHKDAAKEMEIPLGTLKTKNRACLKELRTVVLR
ncbi:RNA polymerase sigma factor [Luteirhabdus pelagi]|uniref:RNA polymerase sigma factor n=1 Tax=Luteirhabdus pelagi TaxID=2792783 RepID=UPI00193AC63E|nr:sigma-70 family RNA polymerase sigma factor [Luteirhabdus pelagi]